jgi:UDP-N-acetylmuramoylalanine--D-glutamate ligase
MAETMENINLHSRRVVVMGLGRFGGGVGVARWLAQQGAVVTITDQDPAENLESSLAQLEGLHITFQLGGHDQKILDACDLLVVNPAVDKTRSEFFQAAVARNVPLTTEINLFLQRCKARVIGVTGSVGKSTTTAMIQLAMAAALKDSGSTSACFLGGNIGRSLLGDLERIKPDDWVVLELSSFMLEDVPWIGFSPHIAVVTNLVGNHLDRHGTLANYAAAKQNILRFQTADDIAILNRDDPVVCQWGRLARGRMEFYTTDNVPEIKLAVPGRHNQSNGRAALAVLAAAGLGGWSSAALKALAEFPGLPHRLQLVHTGGTGVRWFNDSKATTPEAAMTGLAAMDQGRFICIVGGYDKHADMAMFCRQLAADAGGVIGIGATGEALVRGAIAAGLPRGHGVYTETLEAAMALADQWSHGDDPRPVQFNAVLLSPACASYGQFANYEQRGDRFAALARQY